MKQLTNIKKFVSSGYLLPTLAILFWPLTIQAADSVQGISGTWGNVQGGTYIQGNGTSQIYWGGQSQTKSAKSSFEFTAPSPTIFPITLGQTFDLGTFTAINGVIPINAGITGATLTVDVSFNIGGTLIQNLPFVFNLAHDETPNIPGNCLPGSNSACDDKTTFLNNHSQSEVFTINGQQYTIDITGFFANGQLAQQFMVPENKTSSAILEGIITTAGVNVPEPSTYLILGSTMAITMFALRQRKALKNNI
jgi:hypothetical protein